MFPRKPKRTKDLNESEKLWSIFLTSHLFILLLIFEMERNKMFADGLLLFLFGLLFCV